MQGTGRARGYTLYELLITLGLVSLVFTLGLPSIGTILANHRVRTEVDAMFHAIHLARKASIMRRQVVTLCPSLDGQNCDATTDWSSGWIMFSNASRRDADVRQRDEPILRRQRTHPKNRITANRRAFSLRATDLRATNGTIVFCDKSARARPRALVVSYTGRPRVTYTDRKGRPYRCAD